MWYQLQLKSMYRLAQIGCDLLKKLYLCGINYNRNHTHVLTRRVVICLKSCIFVVSITTVKFDNIFWIRCDLLKKLYLCGINYNPSANTPKINNVVICLKSCIFVVSITTSSKYTHHSLCCDLLKKLYLCGINYNRSIW